MFHPPLYESETSITDSHTGKALELLLLLLPESANTFRRFFMNLKVGHQTEEANRTFDGE